MVLTKPEAAVSSWKFVTNHALVLLCIARNPGVRVRDVADQLGLTTNGAQHIISELVESGYVTATRVGRRNHYQVHADLPMRHPDLQAHQVGEFLALFRNDHPSRNGDLGAPNGVSETAAGSG